MTEAVLVLPTAPLPSKPDESPSGRLEWVATHDADLDAAIRRALPDMEVDFQTGTRTWTVRGNAVQLATVPERLADLAVLVVGDATFRAI